MEGRHCGTAAGGAPQCAASPAPASLLSAACAGLTSTVIAFCTDMLFSWLLIKLNTKCHFLKCFPIKKKKKLDVSRKALWLTRVLKIPVGMMGCFSQKINQNEPTTIKLFQTWMEFNEYVIPQ